MLGNSIALLCAVTWSCAVILLKLSGARIEPLALNLVKSLVGLPLLILTTYVFEDGLQFPVAKDTVLLLTSGAIGIGIADGIVLRAMRFLGASHIAILECLFSPFVILLSVLWFDERPTAIMLLGGLFILASLLFLTPDAEEENSTRKIVTRKELTKGTILMAGGMLTMACGIVMVKPLFHAVPLVSLVSIRMIGGTIAAATLFFLSKEPISNITNVFKTPHKLQLFAACFFSSYMSIILWIAGYKYLQATVAALLNQTSTVFTVLLAVIFLKEKLTRGKILATISAIIGVILLTF
ncbi:MAG: DMT family transporter [Proteobacteria bacterium]|nr:MAG: DMT family transporter [Pseudomonadota bacterium]